MVPFALYSWNLVDMASYGCCSVTLVPSQLSHRLRVASPQSRVAVGSLPVSVYAAAVRILLQPC